MTRIWWAVAIAAIAGGLRFPQLDVRPMHADEAILADKFGTLLERGSYEYDPTEFHGPVLAYLSVIPAYLTGRTTYLTLDERTLRLVPAVAGVLLALAPLLLSGAIGESAARVAGLIVAVSSAGVFYSRYYIPEMLLALFTAAFLIALSRGSWGLAGASAAAMLATKETAVIALVAALPFLWLVRRDIRWTFFATFGAVLVLCINPFALAQSFAVYWQRGVGASAHVHPPWHYLRLLASEPVLLVAIPGIFMRSETPFGKFMKVYALLLIAIYSAIPYKTPWCVVSIVFAIALQAPRQPALLAVAPVVASIAAVLAWDRSTRLAVELSNPWVYAQTSTDVLRIRDEVLRFGSDVPVRVYTRENLWPLPWYLRANPNVLWSREVITQGTAAPVVLASPEMEAALQEKFYEGPPPGQRELYMNLFRRPVFLRPGVEVRGYVRKSLWDAQVR